MNQLQSVFDFCINFISLSHVKRDFRKPKSVIFSKLSKVDLVSLKKKPSSNIPFPLQNPGLSLYTTLSSASAHTLHPV